MSKEFDGVLRHQALAKQRDRESVPPSPSAGEGATENAVAFRLCNEAIDRLEKDDTWKVPDPAPAETATKRQVTLYVYDAQLEPGTLGADFKSSNPNEEYTIRYEDDEARELMDEARRFLRLGVVAPPEPAPLPSGDRILPYCENCGIPKYAHVRHAAGKYLHCPTTGNMTSWKPAVYADHSTTDSQPAPREDGLLQRAEAIIKDYRKHHLGITMKGMRCEVCKAAVAFLDELARLRETGGEI